MRLNFNPFELSTQDLDQVTEDVTDILKYMENPYGETQGKFYEFLQDFRKACLDEQDFRVSMVQSEEPL